MENKLSHGGVLEPGRTDDNKILRHMEKRQGTPTHTHTHAHTHTPPPPEENSVESELVNKVSPLSRLYA
jgi:hypothetical protein